MHLTVYCPGRNRDEDFILTVFHTPSCIYNIVGSPLIARGSPVGEADRGIALPSRMVIWSFSAVAQIFEFGQWERMCNR